MSAPIARGVRSIFDHLKNGTRGLIPLGILVVFTCAGAFIFAGLESPNEIYTLKSIEKDRRDLLDQTVFRLNNIRGMKPQAAYNHTVKTLLLYQEKLGVEPIDVETQQKWSYWGAALYCLTVYTTIGYGSIFPVTLEGRILTILYAFLGIPLTLICLYYLGLTFARICRYIWKSIIKSFGCFSRDLERRMSKAVGLESGAQQSSDQDETDELLSFPISFLAFVTIVWILICAAIFSYTESWGYGESLYFTLISFTTIGFGDIVPNEKRVILFAFLLFIGLSLVSTVLNLIQQQIEALASGMQDNIDREYMNALAEAADEGEISETDMKLMAQAADETAEGQAPPPAVESSNKRALDAVISRMPLKERLLFKVMPATSRKQLESAAEQKANRRNRGCQTDNTLLEALVKEEILKMELNNELERRKPRSSMESPFLQRKPTLEVEEEQIKKEEEEEPVVPVRPHRGFKIEKVTEVEHDEEKPVISTTVLQEDDV